MKLTSDIFNINILVLEYKEEYKGYIQYLKIDSNIKKILPIMFIEYITINKIGHYNIIHTKDNINIKENIKPIPIYFGAKFNYFYLRNIRVENIQFIINQNLNNDKNLEIPNENINKKTIIKIDEFNKIILLYLIIKTLII